MPTVQGCRCSHELGFVGINSPMVHLVDRYHIAAATMIVERQQVEQLQPRLVGEFEDAGDNLCGSPLDPFDPLLVCSVEWRPDRVGIGTHGGTNGAINAKLVGPFGPSILHPMCQ